MIRANREEAVREGHLSTFDFRVVIRTSRSTGTPNFLLVWEAAVLDMWFAHVVAEVLVELRWRTLIKGASIRFVAWQKLTFVRWGAVYGNSMDMGAVERKREEWRAIGRDGR